MKPAAGKADYDNDMCESYNAILKCELLVKDRFRNQREAVLAAFDFLEGFYYPRRRPTLNGSMAPIDERRIHAA